MSVNISWKMRKPPLRRRKRTRGKQNVNEFCTI
jgi:hypothetical protein